MKESRNSKSAKKKKRFRIFLVDISIKTPILVILLNILMLFLTLLVSKHYYVGEYQEVTGKLQYSNDYGYQIAVDRNEVPKYKKGIWFYSNSNIRHDCYLAVSSENTLYYAVSEADVYTEKIAVNTEIPIEIKLESITLYDYIMKDKTDE